MSRTPEEWGVAYAARRPGYESFAERLKGLIADLLEADGIDHVQLESRAKTVRSFVEKIQRKGRDDDDPLRTVTDFAGIRIIVYYLEDVERVIELIEREFQVDAEHSGDKADALDSDRFGYRSTHLIARLDGSRRELGEWRPFQDLAVEFQVRTALQHAWAAVSHKLDYKSPDEAPDAVRRRLFRLSALFEIADEQFSTLRDESSKTEGIYADEVGKGQLDIPIDTSSVEVYLKISGKYDRLLSEVSQHRPWQKINGVNGIAVEESQLKRDRSDLVKVLKTYGITTLTDLDKYLGNVGRLDAILSAFDETEPDHDEDSEDEVVFTLEDVLTRILIVDFDQSEDPGIDMYGMDGANDFIVVREALHQRTK